MTSDREFYELLTRLVVNRDALVHAFEQRNYPLRACRRAVPANYLGLPSISFRLGTRELRRPSYKDLQYMGLGDLIGMWPLVRNITSLDAAIGSMLRLARASLQRANKCCRTLAEACETFGIDATGNFVASIDPLVPEGPYCLLPYLARGIAWEGVRDVFFKVSSLITERNVVVIPESKGYTPRAAVNIYVNSDRTVTPPDARWIFWLKPSPGSKYLPTRVIRGRHGRGVLKMGRSPSHELLRRLHLKPHIPFFVRMAEFVRVVSKVRAAHRPLWELVRREPCSKGVRSLFTMMEGAAGDAPARREVNHRSVPKKAYCGPTKLATTFVEADERVAWCDVISTSN